MLFDAWFKKQCIIAGLPDCTAHGLRKAAATRLANAGCSVNEIAAITGHKSLREIAHYTSAADQARLAQRRCTGSLGRKVNRICLTRKPQLPNQKSSHYEQTKN